MLLSTAKRICEVENSDDEQTQIAQALELKQAFEDELAMLGLKDAHLLKPLLNFNELSELYEMNKLGKLVKPL